ncbi:MAG: Pyruvate/ketoisovalerate oxidoreductase, gamma subunit [Acetothermia bacterium 64_32]|nr:MAG: Pyruvate/ketoisovalerate oxidoreductase, gamma subunit [Acetothermia bacterium 64_32]MBC7098467.1 2-oxoacid:acceptor oxidoreductase family protein [Candidatus Bipolaricaulota bacterium]HAF70029.1 2-oxoacid:ferredoxin oxidoreductase subunit gamma [Candidatus Acetothermia bacterium]
MELGVIFAGFGGQGILLAGKVLARAGMDRGLEVTWLPSYGPEMRGGTANCTVVLADEPIGSPIVDAPQALVAMNLPSLDRFEGRVAKDGLIVYNSSLIPRALKRSDVRGIPVPANDIARQLGSPRTINMVALGALLRALGAVPLEAAEEAMAHELRARGRERLIEVNQRALARGFSEAGKYLGDR